MCKVETTDDHDGSVAFGPAGIQLRDLYLLELHRHGKTLVPILGYVSPGPLEVCAPTLRHGNYNNRG